MQLAIEKIKMDGGTQSRVEINQAIVEEYAEAKKTGAEMPPSVVFFDGTDYWPGDGHHRILADKLNRKKTTDVKVIKGSHRDATLYSIGANETHGLRRTKADKRKAVEILLADEEWSEWSNRKIAKACNVSHTFVSSMRPDQETECIGTDDVATLPPENPENASGDSGNADESAIVPSPVFDANTTDPMDESEPDRVIDTSESQERPSRNGHAKSNGQKIAAGGPKAVKGAAKEIREKKKEEKPPETKIPDDPDAVPWSALELELDGIIGVLRQAAKSIATSCDFDKETKRAKRKWAYQISYNGTIGILSQVAKNIKDSLPAEVCEKSPGFKTRHEARLHARVAESR